MIGNKLTVRFRQAAKKVSPLKGVGAKAGPPRKKKFFENLKTKKK